MRVVDGNRLRARLDIFPSYIIPLKIVCLSACTYRYIAKVYVHRSAREAGTTCSPSLSYEFPDGTNHVNSRAINKRRNLMYNARTHYAFICTRSDRVGLPRPPASLDDGPRARPKHPSPRRGVDVRRTVSRRGSRSAVHAGRGGTHGQRATCVGVRTVAKTLVPATTVHLRGSAGLRTPADMNQPPSESRRGPNFEIAEIDMTKGREKKENICTYRYRRPSAAAPRISDFATPSFSRTRLPSERTFQNLCNFARTRDVELSSR